MPALVIVVSNRGPFRFTREPDGTFSAQRGAGGVVSALLPLLANRDDATWVAAAIDDDDVAATAAGAPPPQPGVHARLLPLDPDLQRLHRDVISNATLWFLHHALFDLPRRPRFDRRFREAWEGLRRGEPRVHRRCRRRRRVKATPCSCRTTSSRSCPTCCARPRPDLHVVHFTHTPFCGPGSIRVLPDYVAHAICASMASCTSGFHTERWAQSFRASAREVLGSEAGVGPDVRGIVRARSRDPRRRGRRTGGRAGDRGARGAGR